MDKQISILLICVIVITTLGGCYDAREVDDVIRVLSIGIDRGVSDKWRLTVQFPTIKNDSSSNEEDGQGQSKYTYVTIDAPSFFEGINMLNSSIPRKLIFTHTRIIVLSEDLARAGIMGEFIAPLVRYRQMRKSTHMLVSKGKAVDFIKANEPLIGTTLSKALEMAAKESLDTGYYGNTTLNDFYNDLKSSYSQPLVPIGAVNEFKSFKEEGPKWDSKFKDGGEYTAGELPRQGQNKIEYWGTALFSDDKMITELNGSQTRALLITRGEFKRGFFTVQDPKEPEFIIPLKVQLDKKPKVKISFDKNMPIIDLRVYLKGDILAIQSRLHYEEDPLLTLLENTFKEEIKGKIDQVIDKCKDLNVDVFKFGDIASRHFKTIEEWEKYNWNKRFKNAKVNTHVEFIIKRTGTRIKSSPIPGDKEEK